MGRKNRQDRGRVYSTDGGRICPECDRLQDECVCAGASTAASGGPVRVARQTQGRKGKVVSVVTGLGLDALELAELARVLKQKCGAGGTVRDGAIEIQGEHRDTLVAELRRLGHDAKKSGG
jgi:translation initiation factor 1